MKGFCNKMAAVKDSVVRFKAKNASKLIKWKIHAGSRLSVGTVMFLYEIITSDETSDRPRQYLKFKSSVEGNVKCLLAKEGSIVNPGSDLLELQACTHQVVMKDLCAECGADLREFDSDNLAKVAAAASISMIHSIPELRVSQEQAQLIGQADEERLLKNRKLVLLVDLDQTLIHTTNANVPPDMKDVHHFQLYGPHSPWYHTKFRPRTHDFLKNMAQLYELHICTFGARAYAHRIASLMDHDGKYFSHRILSRDECFNTTSKTGNLKALFPCGDSLVCIIDDREDVWNFSPNLVPVKPYVFFSQTGDINAPPGLEPSSCAVPSFQAEIHEKRDTSLKVNEETSHNGSEDSSVSENSVQPLCSEEEGNASKVSEPKNAAANKEQGEGESDTQSNEAPNTKEIYSESSETVDTKENKHNDCKNGDSARDDDDHLLYLEEILTTIHTAFYDMYDQMKAQSRNEIPDLKTVIPYVQRKVLKGVNIVFSGLIPTNADVEKSKLWILAKSLGANVAKDLGKHSTHVVASKLGTAKVNQAKRLKGMHVVNPEWLACCAERWEHVDERLFPLRESVVYKKHQRKDHFAEVQAQKTVQFQTRNQEFGEIKQYVPCPVYDPVTGKRIRPTGSSAIKTTQHCTSDEAKFAESISPLLSFSTDEIEQMGREVDDACSEDSKDSSESEGTDKKAVNGSSSESSSGESLSGGDCPKGWKKRKRDGENRPPEEAKVCGVIFCEDDEPQSKSNRREFPTDTEGSKESESEGDGESIGSVDEEMAAAVEREFLS